MKRLLSVLSLCLFSSHSFAVEQSKLQLHGFASQALIFTSDNQFFGDSDHGSSNFNELGLNASYQLIPRVRIAAQVLSRNAGEMANGSPRLDYALLDIDLFSSNKGRFGAFLGKVKNPLALYNDTRDVAHTRQGIFPAQSIYFDKVRDLALSSNGVHLYSEYYLSNGTLLMQAGLGYPTPDDNVEYSYMGRDWAGDLAGDNLGLFGKLVYEHNGGRWIFSLTGASIELDFNHKAADQQLPVIGINSGKLAIDYTVLSVQFNGEKWQITSEVALQDIDYQDIGGVLFSDKDSQAVGFTIEANYKFHPQWQSFIRYESFSLDKSDKKGRDAERESQARSARFGFALPILPAHSNYSRSWVIGTRWDLSNNIMARAEYHRFNGTGILSPRENDIYSATKDWDLFALSLSYRF